MGRYGWLNQNAEVSNIPGFLQRSGEVFRGSFLGVIFYFDDLIFCPG
jgi:hypothetical protein